MDELNFGFREKDSYGRSNKRYIVCREIIF